jgi:Flp pilus assembly protein TadG
MLKIIVNSARRWRSKGQSMTEFMLVMIPAMIILFVAVQFAIIARDATALGQFAYQAARLAAAPSGSKWDGSALVNYITTNQQVMPLPVAMIANAHGISYSGSSTPTPNGVVVAMNCPGVTDCTQRSEGSQVQVVVTMSIINDLFLGQSFLGVVFPSTLSNQSSAFTQG